MEFRRRIIHSVLVLLALSCYLCEARWINNDTRSNWDINSNVTLSLNQSRNGSTVTGRLRSICGVFHFTFISSLYSSLLHFLLVYEV